MLNFAVDNKPIIMNIQIVTKVQTSLEEVCQAYEIDIAKCNEKQVKIINDYVEGCNKGHIVEDGGLIQISQKQKHSL